jgi:4-methylaminobutanoate oxidase (formaldehyde-forming)
MAELPTQAQAVVIGGGIIGTSTAYHLAKLGWKDVILIERNKLTSGTTFHAAGLVGQLRSSANITQLLGESVKLYQTLEQETGLATGWKMNGGLRLACNEERWTEVRRQATTARSFGLEMHLLSPKEAQDLWPLMDVSDVVGAAFLPTDGQANPSDITQSLAKGARMNGARIFEDTEVTGIEVENGRVRAVQTSRGRVACEAVVNCAGQWAREVGAMAGANVPLVSVEHQYMVTEPIPGVASNLPTLRDPDRLTYYKEEVGGLVMGGYEPNPIPWAVDGFPKGVSFHLLQSDFDHFEQLMELALGRVPALETAGVKQLINGPKASRRTATSSWARRRRCGASSSARASTPSASRRAAARARRWRSGSSKAGRPTTCGPWTSSGSAATTRTCNGCGSGPWRPTASTTPSPGRTRSIAAGVPCGARLSTACS